jgi:hypothetical protein
MIRTFDTIKTEDTNKASVFDLFITIGLVGSLIMTFIFGFIEMINIAILFMGIFIIMVGVVAIKSMANTLSLIHGVPFIYILILGMVLIGYVCNNLYFHYQFTDKQYWVFVLLLITILGIMFMFFPYFCYIDDRKKCTVLITAECTRIEKRWNTLDKSLRNQSVFTYYPVYSYEYHDVTYDFYKKKGVWSRGLNADKNAEDNANAFLFEKKKLWINPEKPKHACEETFNARNLIWVGIVVVIVSCVLITMVTLK